MNLDSDLDVQEVSLVATAPLPFGLERAQLARSTVFNFVGQLLPLIAGLGLMPYIVKGLGPDRFGVLGIVWVIFNYFSIFDFGLGRATTKFLAEWLAQDNLTDVPALVWISVVVQVTLGLSGALVLCGLTPLLVNRVLKVPKYLVGEVRITFLILAISLPFLLASNAFRAVLEGCQRFDIVNLLRAPASVLVFLIPAVALPFGLRLPGIVTLLAISRMGFAIAHLVCCLRVLPSLRRWPVYDSRMVWSLLSFGSWVTVANIINPILLSLDRILIGSVLSVAMVGYYSASFEAVTKLWIIPASLTITIFPACSSLGVERKRELQILYSRAIKYLLLTVAPLSLVLCVFARQIMQLWLGADFAAKSTLVLQILALGVFMNCFAHVPYCFLQGLGRPRLTATLFLCELPPYAAFAWWTIRHWGIDGAATAWSIRAGLEALLLMTIAWRIFSLSPRGFLATEGFRGLAALAVLALAMVITQIAFHNSVPLEICFGVLWLAAFALAIRRYVLDDLDRMSLLTLWSSLRNGVKWWNAA